MWVFGALPLAGVDPAALVRVDDPDHPDAIARSATGAVLLAPPQDGTRWRWESVPEADAEDLAVPEAVRVTNADLWHADGVTGRGVKVAVLDVGWFAGETVPDAIPGEAPITHDCFVSPSCEPAFDPLRPHLAFEGGVHGWACAETVRTIAPDVELHLVRANTFTMYENAVDWAIREGVDLVTLSMSYYNDSFYDGTGPHAELVERLDAAGILLVTSAGNNARQHWHGRWVDADGDGRLDGPDGDGLLLQLDASATVYVNWNQHTRCGLTDLDVVLTTLDGAIVGRAEADQSLPGAADDGRECSPVERLSARLPEAGIYRLEIVHRRGSVLDLELDVLTRSGSMVTPIPSASSTDPAVHPSAVAVGAVRAADYWDGPPEAFSSWGPTHGGAPKPDIAGPDGLSTVAFGPDGFYGTSASTPVVTGLVALVMSDDPSLTPREAFERVAGWSRSSGAPAFAPDPRFGAGKARLPVRDPEAVGCGGGRGPMWMGLPLVPLLWRRPRYPAARRSRWSSATRS